MANLENPAVNIYGPSMSTPVGTLSDGTNQRLLVNTLPAAGVAVSQPAIGSGAAAKTVLAWLSTTGGGPTNNSLIVNGSSTAQVFYFTPKVATLNVYYIRLIMCAAAFAPSGASFGGAGSGGLLGTNNPAALTKGITISATIGGVQTVIYTMLVNEDFYALNGGARPNDNAAGLALVGDLYMNQLLTVNSGDQVAVTIQDNMTGRNLTSFRACFCGVRV